MTRLNSSPIRGLVLVPVLLILDLILIEIQPGRFERFRSV
jgi:hypothetical protein